MAAIIGGQRSRGWNNVHTAKLVASHPGGPLIESAQARPRLLLLVTSTQRRGGEVFGERIAEGLAERGWEVQFRSLVTLDELHEHVKGAPPRPDRRGCWTGC